MGEVTHDRLDWVGQGMKGKEDSWCRDFPRSLSMKRDRKIEQEQREMRVPLGPNS